MRQTTAVLAMGGITYGTIEAGAVGFAAPHVIVAVVSPAAREQYAAAAMMAFVGFAVLGFFTSLASFFVSGHLCMTSHVVAGIVTVLIFAASAVFQVFSSRRRRTAQFTMGLVMPAAGIGLVSLSSAASSLPLLIVAVSGVRVTFKAAIGTVDAIPPAKTLGEALAGQFLAVDVRMALPALLLG